MLETSPRIRRQAVPPVMRGRDGYRNAEPYLRSDFGYRCAYCGVHERAMGGAQAFCIDHFKPRSRGGASNDYTNLYWVCIPCNSNKHDRWPSREQRRKGYRFADPCREQDLGVHFVGSHDGLLRPLTPCGEYHVSVLRLNRLWLCELRRERLHKQSRLDEALQLCQSLELAIETQPSDAAAEMKHRMLAFLYQEIEALQNDLAVAISLV